MPAFTQNRNTPIRILRNSEFWTYYRHTGTFGEPGRNVRNADHAATWTLDQAGFPFCCPFIKFESASLRRPHTVFTAVVQFSNSRPNFELTGARTPPSTPMGWRGSALTILSRVLSSNRHRQGVDSVSNRPSIFDNDGSSREGVLL
jgi:hypothetical protein